MDCIDLIITDGTTTVTVPVGEYGFDVTQSYSPAEETRLSRTLDGELTMQAACGQTDTQETPGSETEATLRKKITDITITGRLSLAIANLNRAAVWTIHCVTPITDYPGTARTIEIIHALGVAKYPIINARPHPNYPVTSMDASGNMTWTIRAEEV